jgi:hypothetical protein
MCKKIEELENKESSLSYLMPLFLMLFGMGFGSGNQAPHTVINIYSEKNIEVKDGKQ